MRNAGTARIQRFEPALFRPAAVNRLSVNPTHKAREFMPPKEPQETNPFASKDQTGTEVSLDPVVSGRTPEAPAFKTLETRHWVLSDLLRVFLILLSITVLGALILILAPQTSVDGLVQKLQARHTAASPEQIGLLYLGDESANNEFRVRGVIRNITAMPIEQLDAIVRFYAHDRRLLETAVVRMSKDTIDPGAIAQFELVYPNYRSEFGSYSVDYKLRRGAPVLYKDMRATQSRTEQP
jgi:hypothetical protein